MKYIRTKDGIIKYSDYYFIDNTCEESFKSCNGVYYLSPKDIIKQADTIDELINRYVIVTKTRNYSYKILTRYQFGNLSRLKLIEGIKEGKIKVFGAIWTDKGLTYVAKMNEKGELESL